ncbi:hypothetical protein L1887_03207 [Cichorium endivia]|nr:hypothetical protein L1887_03207 [Cichorium endivia]
MTSGKLRSKPSTIDVHGMIKTKYASCWGLQVKAPTKVNMAKIGAMNWRMLFPTVTTNPLKPMMILDREKKAPKLVIPDLDLGRMVNDDNIFRQNFCIRSYEIGPDRTATVETIMNLLQETNAIHLKTLGFIDEDFSSAEMSEKNITWVMVKMQMIVDRYPTWGDIVQINTWKSAYGKNGGCSNFILCDAKTSEILGRASSFWVMMNRKTRKLSKFPNEIQAEKEKYFVNTPPIVEQDTVTWSKRDATTEDHICKGLLPRWSDLDFNQHVNNVKYIGWILESVPKNILENYEIDNITLEYYRECTKDSVVQSVTSILANHNGEIADDDVVHCQHLLQFEISGGDIMKARTRWRPKYRKSEAARAC